MSHARHLGHSRGRIPGFRAIVLFGALGFSMLSTTPCLASPACVRPDNGFGTADLPPGGCAYDAGSNTFKIIDGLPAGTQIDISAILGAFSGAVRFPGGSLSGEIEQFQATFSPWDMTGTGTLVGFHRVVTMTAQCETHAAPRTLGPSVQSFATDLFMLQAQLPPGDPDFDLLRITAGTGFGMPSPGHTTLTRMPTLDWNVDSFFDITYRIDFIGRAGSPLAGRSGSTTGTIRMQAGQPVSPTRTSTSTWSRVKAIYR